MTEHLKYKKDSNGGDNSGSSRNRYNEKIIMLENQTTTIEVPRDRNSIFKLVIIPKCEKQLSLFNDQIISIYSFGITDRDIKVTWKRYTTGSIARYDKPGLLEALLSVYPNISVKL